MKALMLSAAGFEDTELLVPYYRLLEAGAEVDIAAPEKGAFEGKHGYSAEADLAFADVDPDGYDLLVLPGGKGPETVRLNEDAVAAAKKMFTDGKPVASICHGVQVLISADVLEGRTGTCWQGIQDDLAQAGATVADEDVVIDDNWISSRQPSDLPVFNREIMKKINP